MTFASRNLTLDAQSQQESHVKWTSLCIEPNAKSLKLFNPQSQPKMPSDTVGVRPIFDPNLITRSNTGFFRMTEGEPTLERPDLKS
jgi:hypothetical protein